jgi:ABC-type amino acid transport substrate-binding protein
MSLRAVDREALARIESLARSGMHSAPLAMQSSPQIAELASALAASMDRRYVPSRILTPPLPGSIVVGTTPLVSAAFTFQDPGRVVGVRGIVIEGWDLLPHVEIQILDQAGLSFVTNGRGPAFVNLGNLAGFSKLGSSFFPLEIPVMRGETWTVSARSRDTSGTATYTPELAFLFEQDAG